MIRLKPQYIHSASGDELVVLTRAEFDTLVRAADEAAEDAEDVAIYDARKAELDAGRDELLPREVSALVMKGDSLLRALRKWRGLTQEAITAKTGLAQGFLSDLESGKKAGAPETMHKIAEALEVDPAWLGARDPLSNPN
jgi:hypothetical protein